MRLSKRYILIAIFVLAVFQCYAYKVWTNLCKMPGSIVNNTAQWDKVATHIDGINAVDEEFGSFQPKLDQWSSVINSYSTDNKCCFFPFKRSAFRPEEFQQGISENFITNKLKRKQGWGFNLRYVLLCDSCNNGNDDIPVWTDYDVEILYQWLHSNGYSDVKLIYNVSAYNNRWLATNSHIYAILNEGTTGQWKANINNRWELLQWTTTNPLVKYKPFIFQINIQSGLHNNSYEAIRKMIRMVSADILKSTDFIRTDRAIVLPIVHSEYPTNFPFLPQHNKAGNEYGNSMCGLLLSLIEQKDKFEGRNGFIAETECESFSRIAENNDHDNAELFSIKLKVYPNPTIRAFTIDFGEKNIAMVSVYNTEGKRWFYDKPYTSKIEIRTSKRINAGLNYIKIIDERGNTYTERIIIE